MKLIQILSLIFLPAALSATDIILEGKVGYFYPTDNTTRQIMGGGPLFGLESSFQAYRNLYPWLSVSILPNSGHSIGENNKTSMILVPIGIGLKYLISSGYNDFYIGAGALPAYLHTKDESPFVRRISTKWGIGGIFKAGSIINFNCFLVDIFVEYTTLKMNFSNTSRTEGRNADLSGFSAGAAIGYKF